MFFRLQKSLTIFGSALYGGAILSTTVDYFAENSAMLLWVWDRVSLQSYVEQCWLDWWSWAILAVWPATLVLGEPQSTLVPCIMHVYLSQRNSKIGHWNYRMPAFFI